MLYPNLTAEFEASGYSFDTLAKWANTTQEMMYFILYDNEDITVSEASALYKLFTTRYDPYPYSMQYLSAPKLSVLNPKKAKTRHRTIILRKKLQFVSGLDWDDERHEKAKAVYAAMIDGESVTYASYRHSIADIDLRIAIHSERLLKAQPRRKEGAA